MDRRQFVALTALFASTPETEIYNLFGDLATALSQSNTGAFMKRFDSSMEGYGKLREDISALMAQDLVSAFIEVTRNEGDEQRRTVDLDWSLVIVSQQPTGPTVRRRTRVICKLELRKKKWVIVSLNPLSFFAPPSK